MVFSKYQSAPYFAMKHLEYYKYKLVWLIYLKIQNNNPDICNGQPFYFHYFF